MEREQIGQANHVHTDNDVSTLDVSVLVPGENDRDKAFVIIDTKDSNGVIVNSLEQWKQLNAFVLRAFNELE